MAGATGPRRAGSGNVEGLIWDERSAPTLFDFGNPAGLALLPVQNRVEAELGAAISAETLSDGAVTDQHLTGAARMFPVSARRAGWTQWFNGEDVLRVNPPVSGGGELISHETGTASSAAFGHLAFDAGADFEYARRLTPRLSIGARITPITGRLYFPELPGIPEDSGRYRLIDYAVGMAVHLPAGGPGRTMEAGLTFRPYDDVPDPLDALGSWGVSAGGQGGLGGFTFSRRIVFDNGTSQTLTAEPAGTILGAAATWSVTGYLETGLAVDRTTASVRQRTETDLRPVGGIALREEGLSYELARTRMTAMARWLHDREKGRQWRVAGQLRVASSEVAQLDFPRSRTVIVTRRDLSTDVDLGAAYAFGPRFSVGLGLEIPASRLELASPLGGPARSERTAGSTIRLGCEGWPFRHWALRGGFGVRNESTDDDDATTPTPGTPGNPRRTGVQLAAGVGYAGRMFSADLSLAIEAEGENPPPAPPEVASRARFDARLATVWVW